MNSRTCFFNIHDARFGSRSQRASVIDTSSILKFHMNFGRVLLGLVCVLSAAISHLAYSATRVVFQDELLSETQSNALIGTGDVAFSKQDYGTAMQSYVAA